MNKIPAVRGNASLTGIFSNRCLLFAFCYDMIEKQEQNLIRAGVDFA